MPIAFLASPLLLISPLLATHNGSGFVGLGNMDNASLVYPCFSPPVSLLLGRLYILTGGFFLERSFIMHFFNGRFKPFFLLRSHRAQFKHFKLNQRLRNVIALDYLEGSLRLGKFNLKGGDF